MIRPPATFGGLAKEIPDAVNRPFLPSGGRNERPQKRIIVVMLFYQFLVSRKTALAYNPDRPTEARVMVRVDSDVETCTNEAVHYLAERGWKVTGVRHAQMADSVEEFVGDDILLRLYHHAARQGIACAISALRNVTRQPAHAEHSTAA